jgi:hypothetical protein
VIIRIESPDDIRPARHGDAFVPPVLQFAVDTLEELAEEVLEGHLQYDSELILFDQHAFIFAHDRWDVRRPGRIPFRVASYFQVLAAHPGIHEDIRNLMNERMEDSEGFVDSVEQLRGFIEATEPVANPFRRPAPLGVSLGIRSGIGADARILVSQRSRRVAINPGTCTTAIDEGVHDIEIFPVGILADGVSTELGIRDSVRRWSLLDRAKLLGLTMFEEGVDSGKVSGHNVLFDLEVGEDEIADLAIGMARNAVEDGHREEDGPIVCSPAAAFQLPDISHTLFEYLNFVTRGTL